MCRSAGKSRKTHDAVATKFNDSEPELGKNNRLWRGRYQSRGVEVAKPSGKTKHNEDIEMAHARPVRSEGQQRQITCTPTSGKENRKADGSVREKTPTTLAAPLQASRKGGKRAGARGPIWGCDADAPRAVAGDPGGQTGETYKEQNPRVHPTGRARMWHDRTVPPWRPRVRESGKHEKKDAL